MDDLPIEDGEDGDVTHSYVKLHEIKKTDHYPIMNEEHLGLSEEKVVTSGNPKSLGLPLCFTEEPSSQL